MRTVLLLVAVFAIPLAVVAQPAAESDKSTNDSELVTQARKATMMSDVIVEGCRMPADSEAYSTRSSRPSANEEFDAPTHPNKRTKESAGTREFILQNIVDFRKGTADFVHMGAALVRVTRASLPQEKFWIVCRGAFKDIQFLHVSQDGYDDFEVDFSRGAIEWEVKPLDFHQVTNHWAARFYYPEPTTRDFDDFLMSMERGRPNYGRLAPSFAPILRAQWPTLQQAFQKWRGPHFIVFLRQESDGSYVYKVSYGDHFVFWTVAPLDATGKITGLTYDEGA